MLTFALIFLVILAFAGFYDKVQCQQQRQKEELVSYVNEAVKLIEAKGEASFPELRSSKWYKDDRYIFVWQLDGLRVVYPPDPSGENKNMSELKDITGKPIGKLFIEAAEKGEGWVEYMWPKPGEKKPSLKITYIKKAKFKNKVYLVGSGIYVDNSIQIF
ncbi:MAG: sodium:calcium antiporter [Euryarchaeota archaeon]|nr:sodium:calcium antiporter [Euryarchaeota archaeon]